MACGTFFWQELLTQASSLLQSTSGGAPLNIVDFLPQQTPNPALPTVFNNPALGGLPSAAVQSCEIRLLFTCCCSAAMSGDIILQRPHAGNVVDTRWTRKCRGAATGGCK